MKPPWRATPVSGCGVAVAVTSGRPVVCVTRGESPEELAEPGSPPVEVPSGVEPLGNRTVTSRSPVFPAGTAGWNVNVTTPPVGDPSWATEATSPGGKNPLPKVTSGGRSTVTTAFSQLGIEIRSQE
ncbi:MAG: hypothetical protein AAGD06_17350 [Acidobacteriota bacterium]